MNAHTPLSTPYGQLSPEERAEVMRRGLEIEIERRRKLNNIPDGFLTPSWLELAVAKDWTLVNGRPSPVRSQAEAKARGEVA